MEKFYSNGKLLITGEYFVLKGAKALAVPTKFGQHLSVVPSKSPFLNWKSLRNDGSCWLEAVFELPKLRLVSATLDSEIEGGKDRMAEDLFEILLTVKRLNPAFLRNEIGFELQTNLDFPTDWGLGTSSTLINNLANWADVNPYDLLAQTFGGSGYDIAAAQHNSPILYQKKRGIPLVNEIVFSPNFSDQLFFVYLNAKQSSREGIRRFNEVAHKIDEEIKEISQLTDIISTTTEHLRDFELLLKSHEELVASVLKNKPIQEVAFSDYFGQIKSLGAWGGDFILATGNENSPGYFRNKGFDVVIPYKDMVL